MYKQLTLTLIFLFILSYSFAQKLYIWCPGERTTQPHVGFLNKQEINVVLFDGRSIPSKSKVECESGPIKEALTKYIQEMYPSCKMTIQPDSDYYKPSVKGKITIKIGIGAYQAGFGTDISIGIGSVGGQFTYGVFPKGEWNGLVNYYVQIFDNRKESERKVSKEISEVTSKTNLWGYKTAKTCLFASYDKANQSMLSFIEDTLMQ